MNAIIEREEAERKAWEASKVVTAHGETIADLRKVFESAHGDQHWKKPFAVFAPHQIVGTLCRAIEFFHGCKAEIGGIQPITGKVYVASNGYACD